MDLGRSTRSLLLVLCTSSAVQSAGLVRLKLIPDGSIEPPGDRIDLVIALAADEEDLELQIRAVLVSGASHETVTPVPARGVPYRDRQGNLRVSLAVAAPPGGGTVGRSVIVPYEAFDLSPGTYQLAYEVHGGQEGQPGFLAPTRLSLLRVTKQPRTTLEQSQLTVRARPAVKRMRAYQFEDGNLVLKEFQVRRVRRAVDHRVVKHEVRIEGGFWRYEQDALGGLRRPTDKPPRPSHQPPDSLQADRPFARLDEFEPQKQRQIRFATNRRPAADPADAQRFSAEIGQALTYGSCRANIPIDMHRRGELERPQAASWWRKREAADPQRHFLVETVRLLNEQGFYSAITDHDVLLFVHGFGNGFEDAVLRTAQLQHDLEFPGTATVFSWPSTRPDSDSLAEDYRTAERQMQRSEGHLSDLLTGLLQRRREGSVGEIHLIAHSLGCRLLLQAVGQIVTDGQIPPGARPLASVVLAAPDVSPDQFENLAPALLGSARRFTYYYSLKDFPLQLSQGLHQDQPPVGLVPFFHAGVDTINADHANDSALYGWGHGYYAASDPLLTDLRLLMVFQFPPQQRQPPLQREPVPEGISHWSFLDPEVVAIFDD